MANSSSSPFSDSFMLFKLAAMALSHKSPARPRLFLDP